MTRFINYRVLDLNCPRRTAKNRHQNTHLWLLDSPFTITHSTVVVVMAFLMNYSPLCAAQVPTLNTKRHLLGFYSSLFYSSSSCWFLSKIGCFAWSTEWIAYQMATCFQFNDHQFIWGLSCWPKGILEQVKPIHSSIVAVLAAVVDIRKRDQATLRFKSSKSKSIRQLFLMRWILNPSSSHVRDIDRPSAIYHVDHSSAAFWWSTSYNCPKGLSNSSFNNSRFVETWLKLKFANISQ